MNRPQFFYFSTCLSEIIDIFPCLKKAHFNIGFFSDTIKARSFKLCMTIALLCRFDDLDFVSRSQVCQRSKLQIECFGFLSSDV